MGYLLVLFASNRSKASSGTECIKANGWLAIDLYQQPSSQCLNLVDVHVSFDSAENPVRTSKSFVYQVIAASESKGKQ